MLAAITGKSQALLSCMQHAWQWLHQQSVSLVHKARVACNSTCFGGVPTPPDALQVALPIAVNGVEGASPNHYIVHILTLEGCIKMHVPGNRV